MNKKIPFLLAILIIIIAAILLIILTYYSLSKIPKTQEILGGQEIKTEVVHYTPPADLPGQIESGSCWTSSIAAPYRQDVWRCMMGNGIEDPCFSTSQKDKVLCGANPAIGEKGFQLKLTEPLPEAFIPPVIQENWAWMLELKDGTICAPFTGTRPFIENEAAYYGCESKSQKEQIVLLGDLNKSPIWTAKKAVIMQAGNTWIIKSLTNTQIKTVWQ